MSFLDKYKIIKKIGTGSYGTVYKVSRISDDKVFATKYFKCSDPGFIKSIILRETMDDTSL